MMPIRPLRADDIPALARINATFTSDTVLEVEKTGAGLEVGWRLVERRLPRPFERGDEYNLRAQDLKEVGARLARDDTLLLVAEAEGRPVAFLDLEALGWNNTGWLWTLYVDLAYRGQGLGRRLFERATRWCARRGLRAIVIETQTNNVPACRFYAHMGCTLAGINEVYYTNRDLDRREVALFWAYRTEANEA